MGTLRPLAFSPRDRLFRQQVHRAHAAGMRGSAGHVASEGVESLVGMCRHGKEQGEHGAAGSQASHDVGRLAMTSRGVNNSEE